MNDTYQVVSNTQFLLHVEQVTPETATGVFYNLAQLREEFLGKEYIQDWRFIGSPFFKFADAPFIKIDMIVEHVHQFFKDNPTTKSCPNMVDMVLDVYGINDSLKLYGIKYLAKHNAFYRYQLPSDKKVNGNDTLTYKRTMISTATTLFNSKFDISITFKNTKKLKLKDYHKQLIQVFQNNNMTFGEIYQAMVDQDNWLASLGKDESLKLRTKLHNWWFQ